ncbi:hypothetical protein [Runella zeae]|uniref:hypothetical protein n=1 Tax=Runella zeae TaxID=94255 RepID=UPI0023575CE5|nr:hypothetical protein [Runella zeae]
MNLPQLPVLNNSNVPGLDLIRLIDVREVAGLMSPETVWSGAAPGCLPVGGFIPTVNAKWIELRFTAGMAHHTETLETSPQGEGWRQLLTVPIPIDSPERSLLTRILSRGRWLALRMDGNEVIRLIGTPAQPLKLKESVFTTSTMNAWTLSLSCLTPRHSYYLSGWSEDQIYGNPADFNFDFSLDFNA